MDKDESGNPNFPSEHFVERRKSPRLRILIDDMRADIAQNRRTLELQALRIDRLTDEIDVLKRALFKP